MWRQIALVFALAAGPASAEPAYEEEIQGWRAAHEAELRADDGWLAVAGLFWLEEGTSRFGSAPDNEIVFPPGSAPPLAGTLERHGGRIVLRVAAGAAVSEGGAPVTEKELRADSSGKPDILSVGRLSFHIIERNGRFGVRLRDPDAPGRKSFAGLRWYPISPRLRIAARFVPYADARTLQVPNVLGDVVAMPNPGRAVFRLGGKQVSLEAVDQGDELFFIFSDGTTGKTTYPGGRFLYTGRPKDGVVMMDFNKAESPPCAFTSFATCPLPPKDNRLRPPVEAGEKYAPPAAGDRP